MSKNALHRFVAPIVRIYSDVRGIVQATTAAAPPAG
jgi:hypothetical protein